MRYNFDS